MSVHTLSTYTVHVPASPLVQRLRTSLRTALTSHRDRVQTTAALSGRYGQAQRDEVLELLGRR